MKGGKCTGGKIGMILVIIGAINWGLVGLGGFFGSDWNVVHLIFGGVPVVEWIIYILVGLAGVGMIVGCACRSCKGGKCEGKTGDAKGAGCEGKGAACGGSGGN